MKLNFDEILYCPYCKEDLSYEKKYYFCTTCKNKYQIAGNNVISFSIENKFEKEFDSHWANNDTIEIPKTKINVAKIFLEPLNNFITSSKNQIILDAGCGDAVHANALNDLGAVNDKAEFIGIDLSLTVQHRNSLKKYKNWSFIHGDITKLPFRDESFDAVFSYGVICYTNKPEKTFSELCRTLKQKGLIGIWVYPKKKGISGLLFSFVRKICKLVSPIARRLIADCIVPFLSFLPIQSKVNLFNSTWKQCREVVLVNIAPKNLYFPEPEEVRKWFVLNNCRVIKENKKNPITMWAEKL